MNMQFLNDFQQVEQLTRILNKMDMRHAKNMAMRHRTQSTKLNVHSLKLSLTLSSSKIDDELHSTLAALDISGEILDQLVDSIESDCRKQLELDNKLRQRMLETCTQKIPSGNEEGEFVVVDFGGRFFRFFVELIITFF